MTVKPAMLFSVICCIATAPTQDRLRSIVDRQVDNLADGDKRLDALQRLENMAATLVPELRRRLHWQRRDELNLQQQLDLLYILGQAGEAGVAAMPELREWIRGSSSDAQDQLIRTCAQLAPFLDDETGAALHGELLGMNRRYYSEFSIVCWQLKLGARPEPGTVLTWLSNGGWHRSAACRWLIAHRRDTGQLPQGVREEAAAMLRSQLDTMLDRRFVSFWRAQTETTGEIAEALLALTRRPVDARVARGLLQHWHPDHRRRGLLFLRTAARMPIEQRLDAIVRLWDGDPTVADTAVDTVRAWGIDGVVGLPGLISLLELREGEARQPIAAAITAIQDAANVLAAVDTAWLRTVIATLRGEPAETPAEPPTAEGRRLLAEALRMAQWHDAERLGRLLRHVHSAAPDQAIVGSVYSWIQRDNPAVAEFVLAWLARYPKLALRAIDERYGMDVTEELSMLAMFWTKDARPSAIEAGAWILTGELEPAELRKRLGSANQRIQVRAIAELLLHPATNLEPELPTLRKLAYQPRHLPLKLEAPDRDYVVDGNLSEPLRLLAAIGIAHAGQQVEDRKALGELVQEHLGIELHELPSFVALAKRADTLVDVIERCEQLCRRELEIPDHLVWPRAGRR